MNGIAYAGLCVGASVLFFSLPGELQGLEAGGDPASAVDNAFLDAALRPSAGKH